MGSIHKKYDGKTTKREATKKSRAQQTRNPKPRRAEKH